MEQYQQLMYNVLKNGEDKGDRTGTGTRSVFGAGMLFELYKDFPLLTLKKTYWHGIVTELLWMLSGSTNIEPLVDNKVSIWTDWPLKHYNLSNPSSPLTKEEFEGRIKEDTAFADKWGDLGPVYGKQWRDVNGIDQLATARSLIMNDPNSRRIIVNSWNVSEIPQMLTSGLPPCHCFYQFNCSHDSSVLNMLVYIRSDSERLH